MIVECLSPAGPKVKLVKSRNLCLKSAVAFVLQLFNDSFNVRVKLSGI